MPWPCFLIEEADPRVEYLIFHKADDGYHRSVVAVLEGVEWDDKPDDPPDGWPTACPRCGVEMSRSERSMMGTRSWRRPGEDETRPDQHDWGAGAMFDASEWAAESWRGADGRCWGVVLPPAGRGDFWLIDGPAASGERWTRTGEAPVLTVTPSILTPRYHGHLTAGVLTGSLPDHPL
jgi:hypothetical protein